MSLTLFSMGHPKKLEHQCQGQLLGEEVHFCNLCELCRGQGLDSRGELRGGGTLMNPCPSHKELRLRSRAIHLLEVGLC